MQNSRSFSKLSLISSVIFLWTNFILAQTTGLKGIILDKNSGEPLPGANVIISSESLAINTGTASSNNGEFHIANLPAGVYKVTVTYIGYEKSVLEKIEIKNDEIREIDIALNPTGLQLNPITITASRRQERLLDAPASVNIIDAKTIESRTALTPTEHLKALPAIDIITAGLN